MSSSDVWSSYSAQSSPAPSSTASSPPSTSPLCPKKKHVTARQRRKGDIDAAAVYALRPRTNLRSPTPHLEVPTTQVGGTKNGRLQSWQQDILQYTFEAGIRSPGDAIVMLLVVELKDR